MNYLHRILVIILVLLPASSHALEAYFPKEIHQGSTMEFLIPEYEITSIKGTLNNKEIQFFPIQALPRDYDAMPRGAFMHLVMSTGTFPETDWEGELFPDIPEEHPYATAIYQAKALGIIDGYADGNFHPYDSLTRAQAAKILLNAFELSAQIENVPMFTDLPSSHSLAGFMRTAIQAQLFRGYGDGTIKPDRALNMTEAEILLKRASKEEELLPRTAQTYYRGFIGLHRVNDIGAKALELQATHADGSTEHMRQEVTVLDTKYPVNSFSLPPSKTELFEDTKYNKTWEMIDGAKKETNPTQLWEGPFIIPAEGRISMGFGDTVYINGAFSGSHFGIDYANKTGTPVYASNNGIVVLAEETPSYGNTIIIDHGHNVFTMYMHLNSIHTTKESTVQKGEHIGDIGMTGVATGPHLHFNHFIGDVIVDSAQWFSKQ